MIDAAAGLLATTSRLRVSRNGAIVVRTSTVFCRVCDVKSLPLGGTGGTKETGYRYAFHCPSCHNSWSQLRPEDIQDGGDPVIKDGCKKKPKTGKCSCVGGAALVPQPDVDLLVQDALGFADAVNFIATCVASPVPLPKPSPVAPTAHLRSAHEFSQEELAAMPCTTAFEVPAVPPAIPDQWLRCAKRVRTTVDGVPQTYTGAEAYGILQASGTA